MDSDGLSAERDALIKKIDNLYRSRDFNPGQIVVATPLIFHAKYIHLRNLIFSRNYVTWQQRTGRPSTATFPVFGVLDVLLGTAARRQMNKQTLRNEAASALFIQSDEFSAAAQSVERLHAFLEAHDECLEYFACFGCPNLFYNYVPEKRLASARRLFVACVQRWGVSDRIVRRLIVNFTLHAFPFLRALREAFVDIVCQKVPTSQAVLTVDEFVRFFVEAFDDSVSSFHEAFIAVWRAAFEKDADGTCEVLFGDFMIPLADDWWVSEDFAGTRLLDGLPEQLAGLSEELAVGLRTEFRQLSDAFHRPASARPLDAEQVLWQTNVMFFYSEMDDEIVRYITTEAPFSKTPYLVDTLGFRFLEIPDVLTNDAPEFSQKPSKDPAAIALAATWERLKTAGTRNADLLNRIPGAAAGRPTEDTITFLRMYHKELEASDRCISFTIDRLAAWGLFQDAIDEATRSMRAAFLQRARASPPPQSLWEIYWEFLIKKIDIRLNSPGASRDVVRRFAVGGVLNANAIRKCYAQAAQVVHQRAPIEGCIEAAVAEIEPHLPMLREWVQAFALWRMKGTGTPKFVFQVPAAGVAAVDAEVVAMYLTRFEWREGAVGWDMLAFLRLGELLKGLLAALDEGGTPPGGMAQLTGKEDLAVRARDALGALFGDKDQRAMKARFDIVQSVARAVAAVEDVDAFEGQRQMHHYITKEMKEAVWEVAQWFTNEPRPCPWAD
jgi:hypothetical protein